MGDVCCGFWVHDLCRAQLCATICIISIVLFTFWRKHLQPHRKFLRNCKELPTMNSYRKHIQHFKWLKSKLKGLQFKLPSPAFTPWQAWQHPHRNKISPAQAWQSCNWRPFIIPLTAGFGFIPLGLAGGKGSIPLHPGHKIRKGNESQLKFLF